ncbi:MAG: hypothetical protein K8R87_05270 [Verrucomicrobia bacterium]|nr:hypothetical protein [Verrucomicrobiota bacterium]
MGVDRDEKISEPSPGFIITTDNAWSMPAWVWRTLAAIILAAAAYILNQMRLGVWQWGFHREAKSSGTDRGIYSS